MRVLRRTAVLLLLSIFCFACSSSKSARQVGEQSGDGKSEIKLVLREPAPPPGRIPRSTAKTEILSEERTKELTDKLEPLPSTESLKHFERPASKVSPRSVEMGQVGQSQDQLYSFVEDRQIDSLVKSVLPEGKVSQASQLTLSFGRDITASIITEEFDSLEYDNGDKQISIEPHVNGVWRFSDQSTIIFEPEGGEFPKATNYRVTVHQGMSDVRGRCLWEDAVYTFSLPAPSLVPTSLEEDARSEGLNPVFRLEFDQQIKPESVASHLTLLGEENLTLTPLTAKQAEDLKPTITRLDSSQVKKRVLYFKPSRPLHKSTAYELQLAAGVESLEGPLVSEQATVVSKFRTYDPLTAAEHHQVDGDLPPSWNYIIEFNNPLDQESLREKLVQIDPPLAHPKVHTDGRLLVVEGWFRGETDYTITLSPEIKDEFGQTLGQVKSFEMRTAAPYKVLSHNMGLFKVLRADQPARLEFTTCMLENIILEVYKVEPSQWAEFLDFFCKYGITSDAKLLETLKPPGERIAELEVPVTGDILQFSKTTLDLSPYLDEGKGHLVVCLRDPAGLDGQLEEFLWVNGTNLGLDLDAGPQKVVALATELSTGRALPDAQVLFGEAKTTTDKSGLVVFPKVSVQARTCILSVDGDSTLLPNFATYDRKDHTWSQQQMTRAAQWYVFDDRGLYEPGETIHLKAFLREWSRGPQAALKFSSKPGQDISWKLQDPSGVEIQKGVLKLGDLGSLNWEIKLPEEAPLGSLHLTLEGENLPRVVHPIKVQEFRRPEFELRTRVLSDQPHLWQEAAILEVKANYLTGGALADSEVTWQATTEPADFTPPGRDDYNFGSWKPKWVHHWWTKKAEKKSQETVTLKGRTNRAGLHELEVQFGSSSKSRTSRVDLTASVTDKNHQQQTNETSILVHPSRRYVGLKNRKNFVSEDGGIQVDLIVTDLDGHLLTGIPVSLELTKVDSQNRETSVKKDEILSTDGKSAVSYSPENPGRYRVLAKVQDEQGRWNETETFIMVAGSASALANQVESHQLTVVPDKENYHPGETAKLLILAPFSTGSGMVVWSRDGIAEEQAFQLKDGLATVELAIQESMPPNIWARVTAAGKGENEQASLASAQLSLPVSIKSKTLHINYELPETPLTPGAEVELVATVTDHEGQPVPESEVTLWMVDEALLDFVDYKTPDPLSAFYQDRRSLLSSLHNRQYLDLALDLSLPNKDLENLGRFYDSFQGRQESVASRESALLSEEQGMEGPPKRSLAVQQDPWRIRRDFDALVTYTAALKTDSKGRTRVKVALPDNLSRYRIMSVASAEADRFGHGDQVLKAHLPLMLRPSLPRFFNLGDTAELPLVIENQTDQELQVDAVVVATGFEIEGPKGKRVTVPAHDRVKIHFDAKASSAGEHLVRFAVEGGSYADAAEIKVPIYAAVNAEVFAVYGSSDKDEAISRKILQHDSCMPDFGELKVSLSTSALWPLKEAVLYLTQAPFENHESMASRLLTLATFRDVLATWNKDDLPIQADWDRQGRKDALALVREQKTDGGWSYAPLKGASEAFITIHVAHALVRAEVSGVHWPSSSRAKALRQLTELSQGSWLNLYDQATQNSLRAYALYTRELMGEPDVAAAKALLSRVKEGNLEAMAWIWPTLTKHAKSSAEHKELRRRVFNSLSESPQKAEVFSPKGESPLLQSARRTDALILSALLLDEHEQILATKLVRGLLSHREKGCWNTTQETAWVLLALAQYYDHYEKTDPSLRAEIWLNENPLGGESFHGREARMSELEIPMKDLLLEDDTLTIQRTGKGRLYYRLGFRFAREGLRVWGRNRGFAVNRRYRALEHESDVKQLKNGDWEIKAGSEVEVQLEMTVTQKRAHVSLVDHLPAGLELVQRTQDQTQSFWFDSENQRDDRVEVYVRHLKPGTYNYTYQVRATTKGEFVTPPLKAEEVYVPESYGRTHSSKVTIR